jgi:predicted nucleic acid-binding protein
MTPTAYVCVDASLVIKVVVREPDSEKADALFAQWSNEGTHLIAPAFFDVETDSILRQKVILRQELTLQRHLTHGLPYTLLRDVVIAHFSRPP